MPSGIWSEPAGWVIYNILNYMEQQPLHDLGLGTDPTGTKPTAPAKMQANSLRVATPLAGFICPSRRAVALYPFTSYDTANITRTRWSPRATMRPTGATYTPLPTRFALWPSNCYNTACGPPPVPVPTLPGLSQLSMKVQQLGPQTLALSSGTIHQYGPTGIIAALIMISPAEIRDGASNTFLAGEKYLEPKKVPSGV